ncbi:MULTISPECIES: hypothetical protein [Xanthomonas]
MTRHHGTSLGWRWQPSGVWWAVFRRAPTRMSAVSRVELGCE